MQSLRDALKSTLGRSLRELPPLDRLATAWPVVCGAALSGRSEIAGYDAGEVRIAVQSEEWLRTFLPMQKVLQHELAKTSGVPVSAIHFEVPGSKPALQRAPRGKRIRKSEQELR